MLVESDRDLSKEIVQTASPVPFKRRKEREMQFVEFINGNCIRTQYGMRQINSEEDLFKFLSGYNTLASGSITNFHKLLANFCDYKTLFSKRQLHSGSYIFYLMDRFGSFFTIRKGNDWGSLFLIDEEVALEKLCEITTKLLALLHNTGWDLDRIMSPARMAENLFRQKVSAALLPDFAGGEIDEIHIKRAFNCFKGGRMEATRLGYFDNVYDYDFNSSHFSILRELPSIKSVFVKWVDSKDYQKDAILGHCRVRVEIDKNCPIGLTATRIEMKHNDPRLFYNTDETIGWKNKCDIDFLRRSGYANVEILEGSWAIPIRENVKPFRGVSKILEELMCHEETRILAKLVAATSWGKFASQWGGPLWNPFYASEIGAQASVRITELALGVTDSLIAIAIDGLALTKPLPDSVLSSKPIGGMKLIKYDAMLSLSDFYRCTIQDPENWSVQDDGISIRPAYITLPYMMEFGGSVEDIGKKLRGAKIPFGSTKRISPRNLTLAMLERHQFELHPPSSEESVELYLNTREITPVGF